MFIPGKFIRGIDSKNHTIYLNDEFIFDSLDGKEIKGYFQSRLLKNNFYDVDESTHLWYINFVLSEPPEQLAFYGGEYVRLYIDMEDPELEMYMRMME